MVVPPSFSVTWPVGVPLPPETVTLTELALPWVDGSGACTAATVGVAREPGSVTSTCIVSAQAFSTTCMPMLDAVPVWNFELGEVVSLRSWLPVLPGNGSPGSPRSWCPVVSSSRLSAWITRTSGSFVDLLAELLAVTVSSTR